MTRVAGMTVARLVGHDRSPSARGRSSMRRASCGVGRVGRIVPPTWATAARRRWRGSGPAVKRVRRELCDLIMQLAGEEKGSGLIDCPAGVG